jgi:hypothetical protein
MALFNPIESGDEPMVFIIADCAGQGRENNRLWFLAMVLGESRLSKVMSENGMV